MMVAAKEVEVETKIGDLAVRRSIEINAPPERVWEEFTSAERMRSWFLVDRLEYEPRAGGKFEAEGGGPDHPKHKVRFIFTGEVLVYDPPREMTYSMGWSPPQWPDVTYVTFRLTPMEGGRTRVELTHYGFERLGEQARETYEGFEGGWDLTYLEALRGIVER